MACNIFWVTKIGDGKLGTMARPRGGDWLEVEAKSLMLADVDIVISALTNEEMQELDLAKQPEEFEKLNIEFLNFPIIDRGLPDSPELLKSFLMEPLKKLKEGSNVVTHCRMGIGRASILAASLMLLSGYDPNKIFEDISKARGLQVPDTEDQRAWVFNSYG